MICELCNKNKATVYLKEVMDGNEKELFVCDECAGKDESGGLSPMGMADFLFGIGVKNKVTASISDKDEKSCPQCHMRKSDFNKSSRMGCADCYDVFEEELQPMLAVMHKKFKHTGKVPGNEKLALSIERLENDLAKAIEIQDFETAAVIRDNIIAAKESNEQQSEVISL